MKFDKLFDRADDMLGCTLLPPAITPVWPWRTESTF